LFVFIVLIIFTIVNRRIKEIVVFTIQVLFPMRGCSFFSNDHASAFNRSAADFTCRRIF